MQEQSKGIISFFAMHPVAGNLLMIIMIIFGLFGVSNLNRQIMPDDLPQKIRGSSQKIVRPDFEVFAEGVNFTTAVTEYEKALILKALEKTNWVKNRAAELLQIKRTTLVEKIKRYKITKDG